MSTRAERPSLIRLLGRAACVAASLLGAFGAARAQPTDAVATDETRQGASADGRLLLEWASDPSPIPINAPFTLRVTVRRAARPDAIDATAEVEFSALMPEHGHGMNRIAGTRRLDDGTWFVDGLLFHMRGRWDLVFNVRSEEAFGQFILPVTLRPPAAEAPPAHALPFAGEELTAILQHSPLPPLPPDPTNAVADDPRAAALGQFLFFDAELSADRTVSCATCHAPSRAFADGVQFARGIGVGERHTPALWNVAWQRFWFWDGRADSLWSQALQPIENPLEHGFTRQRLVARLRDEPRLAAAYADIFGPLPPAPDAGDGEAPLAPDAQAAVDRAFVNAAKAIAAYERKIVSNASPFDTFVEGLRENDPDKLAALSESARRGLSLFVGRGNCALCHSGPNFSDGEFHSTRIVPPSPAHAKDAGRQDGVQRLLTDPFNGLSEFADDGGAAGRALLPYLRPRTDNYGQFKTPSLRNVALTAPYMHAGQVPTLREVLTHYSTFENTFDPLPNHFERTLVPLHLSEAEIDDLIAFLESLTDTALNPRLTRKPELP